MLTLPDAVVLVLVPFGTLFTNATWRKFQLLLVGPILALTPITRALGIGLYVGPKPAIFADSVNAHLT